MLKFIHKNHAIMDLSLTNVALIIATGIILAAVFSFIFLVSGDWNREAELKNVATSLSTMVEGVDSIFIENTTIFSFPTKDFSYKVEISSEYIIVSSDGVFNDKLSVKKRFLTNPVPQNKILCQQTLNYDWVGRENLHNYLKDNHGEPGFEKKPAQVAGKNKIDIAIDTINLELSKNPILFDTRKPVYLDKTYLYYDDGSRQDFVLVYQND